MEISSRRRIFFPVLVIIVGVLLLFENFGGPDFGSVVGTWWPSLLIILGIIRITEDRQRNHFFAVLLILVGLLLQLDRLDIANVGPIYHLWPLLIIFFGFRLLSRRAGWTGKGGDSTFDSDTLDVVVLFGGVEGAVTSKEFKGGEVIAVFGGAKVDLTKAELHAGNPHIRVAAVCGGIELIVPDNWNINLKVTPVMGGVEDKRLKRPQGVIPGGRTLEISGAVILGGVEIKG